MSATLKADLFASYFAEFGCQLMNIPGRAFPVTSYYLEDVMHLVRGSIQLPYTQKSPYVYAGNFEYIFLAERHCQHRHH